MPLPPKYKHLYRFRPIKSVLGSHQELRNQHLFFSELDKLNDPAEGRATLFWQGDAIIWHNLIKHYLRCLTITASAAAVMGDAFEASILRNLVQQARSQLPDAPIRLILAEITELFFKDEGFIKYPIWLASRPNPISADELKFHLRLIHTRAVTVVVETFAKHHMGILPPPAGIKPPCAPKADAFFAAIAEAESASDGRPDFAELLFSSTVKTFQDLSLLHKLRSDSEATRGWHFACFDFPDEYVECLSSLLYTNWYVSCFASVQTHASMWGNYADGHKGVCLTFRAEIDAQQRPLLRIRTPISVSAGPDGQRRVGYSSVQHAAHAVIYGGKFCSVDFFRSLGNQPCGVLESEWFRDADGNVSTCRQDYFEDQDRWREDYWKRFLVIACTKMNDWSHEQEYRVILRSDIQDFTEGQSRALEYDFNDLVGITFGAKTPLEHKIEIITVIRELCGKYRREVFEFSEAYFGDDARSMKVRPLAFAKDAIGNPLK